MLFTNLKFTHTWRNYQQKFLDEIKTHMADNQLHIIAPPGSGKTIIGIELMRSLGKKALVLAPTITIRNQWKERMLSFFTTTGDVDYSFDLDAIASVTFITYQALHAFRKRFATEQEYITYFKNAGVEVLVLDEAHHLKNEWWNALYCIKQRLNLTVIALTATPPYDSSIQEIKKYFQLCNEVDAEIVVPDLIKEGDLCPHQDFIYFSEPSDAEKKLLYDFRQGIFDFINTIEKDEDFKEVLQQHRFITLTESHLEEILEAPEYFSAIVICLTSMGVEIEKEKLQVLGFEKQEVITFPMFDIKWAEKLFTHLLIKDREQLEAIEVVLKPMETKLRRLHALQNNSVDFTGADHLHKVIANSGGKLQSVVDVVKVEQAHLQKQLRAVVLTDYIRDEYLTITPNTLHTVKSLGAVAVFKKLRYLLAQPEDIAVLTGSLVIVHTSLVEKIALAKGADKYVFTPLAEDAEFVMCIPKSSATLVHIITELFQQGAIKILIGTKSLLGEGWDAPAINTLVLASFVGSFVSSNQMRGRAIRCYKDNPDKTGNIWHLVCLDPTRSEGGTDMNTLERRFDAFLGVAYDDDEITNGLDRLNIQDVTKTDIAELNQRMITYALRRNELGDKWNRSVLTGNGLSKELKQLFKDRNVYTKQKKKQFNDVVKYGAYELLIAVGFFIPEYLIDNLDDVYSDGIGYVMYTMLVAIGFKYGRRTYKGVKGYMRFGNWYKSIDKISKVVLYTLNDLGYFNTPIKNIKTENEANSKGEISCKISGCTNYESSLYINTLKEVLDPVENPRYLIVKNRLIKKTGLQAYYPVPQLFGDKKTRSGIFFKHWQYQLGNSSMIYTRNKKGRKLILKARILHITNTFEKVTKKAVVWG